MPKNYQKLALLNIILFGTGVLLNSAELQHCHQKRKPFSTVPIMIKNWTYEQPLFPHFSSSHQKRRSTTLPPEYKKAQQCRKVSNVGIVEQLFFGIIVPLSCAEAQYWFRKTKRKVKQFEIIKNWHFWTAFYFGAVDGRVLQCRKNRFSLVPIHDDNWHCWKPLYRHCS